MQLKPRAHISAHATSPRLWEQTRPICDYNNGRSLLTASEKKLQIEHLGPILVTRAIGSQAHEIGLPHTKEIQPTTSVETLESASRREAPPGRDIGREIHPQSQKTHFSDASAKLAGPKDDSVSTSSSENDTDPNILTNELEMRT